METRPKDIAGLCVHQENTIRETIACIDRNRHGIALVLDETGRFLDTITDGDIRRGILLGLGLDCPIRELRTTKFRVNKRPAVTASQAMSAAELLQQMVQHTVRHIPVLDEDERVVDLAVLDELLPGQIPGLQAVVMAGGAGHRLHPLTHDTPKPMLPVGGRPLLQIILEQLRCSGIQKAQISTHFKAEKIKDYFGNGSEFGLSIQYVDEDEPLGTAGVLASLPDWNEPLLVVNGDILTRLDFKDMLHFHAEHSAALTMAVRQYDVRIPYGVVETNGAAITALAEKPLRSFFINAGVYLLAPEVRKFIPPRRRFDMTDLIQILVAENMPVIGFPVHEYWLDIGQHADYERAQVDSLEGLLRS